MCLQQHDYQGAVRDEAQAIQLIRSWPGPISSVPAPSQTLVTVQMLSAIFKRRHPGSFASPIT